MRHSEPLVLEVSSHLECERRPLRHVSVCNGTICSLHTELALLVQYIYISMLASKNTPIVKCRVNVEVLELLVLLTNCDC